MKKSENRNTIGLLMLNLDSETISCHLPTAIIQQVINSFSQFSPLNSFPNNLNLSKVETNSPIGEIDSCNNPVFINVITCKSNLIPLKIDQNIAY